MASFRLDRLLVDRGLAASREEAKRLLLAGLVLVGDRRDLKPGNRVPEDAEIQVLGREHPFVGRGGVKLAGALDAFGVSPKGQIAADIGSSTGGFVDCLLQRGAVQVYAIDVGYGQLHWKLRSDSRVVVMERTNARYLTVESLTGDRAGLITVDVSFISVAKLGSGLARIAAPSVNLLVLVKPQFEVGRDQVGRGGIVREPALHLEAMRHVAAGLQTAGFALENAAPSVIEGREGNREFFLHLRRHTGDPDNDSDDILHRAVNRR